MNHKINIYEYPTDPALLPEYRIAVMQAALDPKNQVESCHASIWLLVGIGERLWDWVNVRYRIKRPAPEPKTPTTVMGWLLTLPYECRVLAIRNCDAGVADKPCEDLASAVDGAFYWYKTPEGHDFWSRVKSSIVRGFPLPPIPNQPKPKKLVPWTATTFPIGCVIRVRGSGFSCILTPLKIGPEWVCMFERMLDYHQLKDGYEHSVDGGKTWLPCGTYVDE